MTAVIGTFSRRLHLTHCCSYTNDVETSAKSRGFRSGGIVRRAASHGMCGARYGDDGSRAGVLQEDGGPVRGHGYGEVPSLLSDDCHAC